MLKISMSIIQVRVSNQINYQLTNNYYSYKFATTEHFVDLILILRNTSYAPLFDLVGNQ